jgi:hypothetical protein
MLNSAEIHHFSHHQTAPQQYNASPKGRAGALLVIRKPKRVREAAKEKSGCAGGIDGDGSGREKSRRP